MLIYYTEVPLEEGFEVLNIVKQKDRLIRGREVSRCSGHELFKKMYNEDRPLKCWHCNRVGSLFIVNKGRNDHASPPNLDLFSTDGGIVMLMTRDHIIPRSLGGGNMVENLRIGCSECNGARGNTLDEADRQFMEDHPELIVRKPNPIVPQGPVKTQEEKRAAEKEKRKRRRQRKKEQTAYNIGTVPLSLSAICGLIGVI